MSGETPAAATEPAPVSGVACETMEPLAHTRETPAKARTDRGRGPTEMESNKMDATPKHCPCGGRIVPETRRGVEHLICTSCQACSVCDA